MSSCRFSRSLAVVALATGLFASSSARDVEGSNAFQENWRRAGEAFESKDYRRAAELYARAAEFVPFEAVTRYQIACCNARLGEKDKALTALEAAVNFGFEDAKRIAEADEFKELREDPRFDKLV